MDFPNMNIFTDPSALRMASVVCLRLRSGPSNTHLVTTVDPLTGHEFDQPELTTLWNSHSPTPPSPTSRIHLQRLPHRSFPEDCIIEFPETAHIYVFKIDHGIGTWTVCSPCSASIGHPYFSGDLLPVSDSTFAALNALLSARFPGGWDACVDPTHTHLNVHICLDADPRASHAAYTPHRVCSIAPTLGLFSGLCAGMKMRGDLCLVHLAGYPDAGEVDTRYTYGRAAEGRERIRDVFGMRERTLWVVPRSVDYGRVRCRGDMRGLFMSESEETAVLRRCGGLFWLKHSGGEWWRRRGRRALEKSVKEAPPPGLWSERMMF